MTVGDLFGGLTVTESLSESEPAEFETVTDIVELPVPEKDGANVLAVPDAGEGLAPDAVHV